MLSVSVGGIWPASGGMVVLRVQRRVRIENTESYPGFCQIPPNGEFDSSQSIIR
jgi:hypothetical protein